MEVLEMVNVALTAKHSEDDCPFCRDKEVGDEENDLKTFQRFSKKTNIATPPWYNKEIFIKLFKSNEGRDYDNRHPFPYIAVQVRYDREKNERVVFSPEQAQKLLRK